MPRDFHRGSLAGKTRSRTRLGCGRRAKRGAHLRQCLILLAVLMPLWLGAADQGGGGGGLPLEPLLPQIVWAAVTFLAVLLVLWKTAWPAIMKALDDRARNIDDSLAAAEQARRDAEEERARAAQELEAERQRMRDDVATAEAELTRRKEEMLASAREEASRLRAKAEVAIEQAKMRAVAEIKISAVDLAVAGAEGILKRRFAEGDDRRLAQEVIDSITAEGRGTA